MGNDRSVMTAFGNQPRPARPADYDAIAAVADRWWGRPVLSALPRLFLDHFAGTSLVIDGPDGPIGFLIGFVSASSPGEAYIHFAGVAPQARHRGLARILYQEFFALARAAGCHTVTAVTSPGNDGSIRFHEAMGFAVTGPVTAYNGPGRDRVVFTRTLVPAG